MPRVASEASALPSARPTDHVRRPDAAPEQPFDLLLDTGAPVREKPAFERTRPVSNRSDPTPTRSRRADDAPRPERSTQPAQSEKPTQADKPAQDAAPEKSADQAQDTANPEDSTTKTETAPAADASVKTDDIEADALNALIDATQPMPQVDTPTPVAAATVPPPEILPDNPDNTDNPDSDTEVTVLTAVTANAQKNPAVVAAANSASPADAAANADANTDAGTEGTAAQGAIARQAAPKGQPDKAEDDGKTENNGKAKAAAQPAPAKNDAAPAAAKTETAAQQPTQEKNSAPARDQAQEQASQETAKPHTDRQTPRHANVERPTLPPQASQRANDALDISKPAADPVPNNNPSAPGITVAVNHAAAASAVARADVAAPAIPISGLAVEIAARAQAGRHRFEIRLDPPELGRIDVRLDVDRHGAVTSRLVVDRAETLDLLRRDAAQLERALQDAGLKTGDNSMQFMLRDQASGHEQQAQHETDASRIILPDADSTTTETAPQSHLRWPGLGGGIDIRV